LRAVFRDAVVTIGKTGPKDEGGIQGIGAQRRAPREERGLIGHAIATAR
jgi:hypothetical protein